MINASKVYLSYLSLDLRGMKESLVNVSSIASRYYKLLQVTSSSGGYMGNHNSGENYDMCKTSHFDFTVVGCISIGFVTSYSSVI